MNEATDFLLDVLTSAIGALLGLAIYFWLLKGHLLWRD